MLSRILSYQDSSFLPDFHTFHLFPTTICTHSLPSASTLPPLRHRIKPDQGLGTHIILLPEQLRDIHIQRAVRLSARQQLMYARHGGRDGVCRRPRRLEQIEADLAGLEVDVGVADGGDEADGGRGVRVGGWNVDVEGPAAAWVVLA